MIQENIAEAIIAGGNPPISCWLIKLLIFIFCLKEMQNLGKF